jgi:inorganic pyrophosphatase
VDITSLAPRTEDGHVHVLVEIPKGDPRFAEYHDISDVPNHLLKEIEHFFDVYKELEGEDYDVLGWGDCSEAQNALEAAISQKKGKDQ